MRMTARILAAAGVLALVAVPLFGCGDAGDDGGSPTGATQQYTPGMDLAGATLTAQAIGVARQGGTFDIIATFRDAQGRPVEGVQVWVADEERSGCFGGPTNPSLTTASGQASILVYVQADCVPESYMLTVFTAGPRLEAFVPVSVRASSEARITSVTLTALTPTVIVGESANFSLLVSATPACTVQLDYSATGGGLSEVGAAGYPIFSVGPTTAASDLSVVVRASCVESGDFMDSNIVTVTVTAAP